MPKIPSVIKLKNGEDFNVEEHEGLAEALNTILTQTAKAEKDKLYGTIEEYRKQVNPLVETLTKIAPALDNLAKATPQGLVSQQDIDAAKQAQQEITNLITSDNVSNRGAAPTAQSIRNNPIEAMANQVSSEQAMTHFGNLFKGILDSALGPIVSKIEKMEQKEVDLYIDKVRSENQGKAILELISGKTVDEVNASLANAKEMYQKYFPQPAPAPAGTPAPGTQTPSATVPATTPTPAPATPSPTAPVASTPAPTPPSVTLPGTQTPTESVRTPDYKGMSMDEFASARDKEFAKLKSMYQN